MIANVTVGGNPTDLAVNPVTNMIYTFNSDPGTVSAINGLTNVVTQTVPVGDGVSGITADPNTDEVYLGNQSTGTVMPYLRY